MENMERSLSMGQKIVKVVLEINIILKEIKFLEIFVKFIKMKILIYVLNNANLEKCKIIYVLKIVIIILWKLIIQF